MLKKILEELVEGKYNYTDQRVKEQKITHAISEITKLVPDELEPIEVDIGVGTMQSSYENGWNDCIQQLKTNFGEPEKAKEEHK